MVAKGDYAVTFSRHEHTAEATYHLHRKASPQEALNEFLKRASWRTALTLGAVVGLSGTHALATECGSPLGGIVICDDTSANPYAGGITYNPTGGLILNVESGIVIDRIPGPGLKGIYVKDTSGEALTVNLADGVTITTEGDNANGVEVEGSGDISITSAADITIAGSPFYGQALHGWISDAASGGNIHITQLENSTITVTGASGTSLYGRNDGVGSVTLTASGLISTAGYEGYGLFAWNSNTASGNTAIILNATGSVLTDGVYAAGLYSLNEGRGDALAVVHGNITTLQAESDGVLVDIDTATSPGNAMAVLSATANIHTKGYGANGVWALNWGLGQATITSAATVRTEGANSPGLHANIRNSANTADMSISLESGGSVLTTGASAHGMVANNLGTGAATIEMEAGTSVTTAGPLAHGVHGVTGGTVAFTQAAGAEVMVSGGQSFAMKLEGDGLTAADLNGDLRARGQFGVGAAAFATTGPAEIALGAAATVTGGWQADVTGVGVDTQRPAAGVVIGSGLSSRVTNLGVIGAGSDRAIADAGRHAGTNGNLTVNNGGLITGFVEFAGGGTNVFNNRTSGQFHIRHFADTNGDGVRDTKRVAISDFGAPTSSFNNLAGGTLRLAPVVDAAASDDSGYYIPTIGIDSRPLEASSYTLARSGVVQGQLTNLGSFHNAGVIDLRGTATGNTLVMTASAAAGGAAGSGVFISDGGALVLNAVFNNAIATGGQTRSLADVLVVDSTRMGTAPTTITIDRREGSGGTTPGNGILLVEVRNKAASAPGVFALNGDFAINGEQAVVSGAHAYQLFQNGIGGDSADGNWYLRSLGLAPNASVYEAYAQVLLPLGDVPTLQQRVGNRYHSANPDGAVLIENRGLWARMEGAYGRHRPGRSTSGAQYDTTTWKVQAGLDGLFAEDESGKLIAGVTVNYGQASADVSAAGAKGDISARGYGFGGTLTWYATHGFYADAQAQATWSKSDLKSATLGRKLVDGNEGFGYTLSLESGQRIDLSHDWTLIPQAQLIYTNVRFDRFTDLYGATVSLADGDSLRGRLGLAGEYQARWQQQKTGMTSRMTGYGIINLYNEFLDGTRVTAANTELMSRDDRLWAGLGLGGSYNWNDDKYSVYGELSADTGLTRFGDSFELGGTLGLRVRW